MKPKMFITIKGGNIKELVCNVECDVVVIDEDIKDYHLRPRIYDQQVKVDRDIIGSMFLYKDILEDSHVY